MNEVDARYVRRLMPDEDGGYTATIHEFPGCIADGDTADEAIRNLEEAAKAWIEAAKASGYSVSPPVEFDGASGKIALRISRRLHRQAAERAALEGTSLNQLISTAVASYLGQLDGVQRAMSAFEELVDSAAKRQPIIIPINRAVTSHAFVKSESEVAVLQERRDPSMLNPQMALRSVNTRSDWQKA